MGGKLCTLSQPSAEITNFTNYQLQFTQEYDNPSKKQLQTKFLNTTILASWNILHQKNFNYQDLNPVQEVSLTAVKQQKPLQIQKLQQQSQGTPFFGYIKSLKSYRPSLKQNYINSQINVSDFIQLRKQNIQDFYKFDVKIGQGSFGNVYKCFDIKSKQVRAVKVLKNSKMNNITKMGFVAEIDLFKTLDHPNVVKLYDIFFFSQHYYVVTEYCAGGTLQSILNEYASSINQTFIKTIMRQLISVISYINNLNIVHRDLKLDNIVLSHPVNKENLLENNSIKIIDFGTATKIQMHRKNKSGLVGTIYYMAPQFNKGFFNQKCDIWSAGVIMFLLIFKKYPFVGKTQKQILKSALQSQIDWKKINQRVKFSQKAIQLLSFMLQKNYFRRISSGSILKSSWIQSSQKIKARKSIEDKTVSMMSSYKRQNNFISLIQSFLTFKKTTQNQREQISKIFCQIDADNSGLIEIKQLIQFYKQKNTNSSIAQIEKIVEKIDKNKSGKIDFNEFIGLMIDRKKIFMKQTLKEAFQYLDKDRTGFIQKKELKAALKGSQKKQIEEMFQLIDLNQDNKIQFEQFSNYLLEYNS